MDGYIGFNAACFSVMSKRRSVTGSQDADPMAQPLTYNVVSASLRDLDRLRRCKVCEERGYRIRKFDDARVGGI